MSKSHCGSDSCPGDVYDPASCECGCERCTREDEHDQQAAPHRDRIATLTADLATAIAELAEARRQLGEATREVQAMKAGRWAGAWDGSERRTVAGGKAANLYAVDGWSGPIRWHWQANQCEASGTVDARDAARAAADAHLIAAGWWLEGGPHGTGEAK